MYFKARFATTHYFICVHWFTNVKEWLNRVEGILFIRYFHTVMLICWFRYNVLLAERTVLNYSKLFFDILNVRGHKTIALSIQKFLPDDGAMSAETCWRICDN
jgi:hypothetical protein